MVTLPFLKCWLLLAYWYLLFHAGSCCPLQDDALRVAVARFDGKSWKKIAACLPGRTDVQCLHRWQKVRSSCEAESASVSVSLFLKTAFHIRWLTVALADVSWPPILPQLFRMCYLGLFPLPL